MTLAEELMELQNANNREIAAEEGCADDAGLAFEIDNVDEGTSAQISNNMQQEDRIVNKHASAAVAANLDNIFLQSGFKRGMR